MLNVLYISQDGLLDQLGQSQIYPYIEQLSKKDLTFFVCTIENHKNLPRCKKLNKKILLNKNIHWSNFFYKKKAGKINRLIEVILLYFLCFKIILSKKIQVVHSRSYLPMVFCILAKLIFKKKIIFDTRGSWIDERIDGKMLRDKGIDLLIFKLLKKIEKIFFKISDHIIFLTDQSIKEVDSSLIFNKNFTIIPCASDYEFFKILNFNQIDDIKNQLRINENFIVTYVGSLGSWYNFDQIIYFFEKLVEINPDSKLVIITQSDIGDNIFLIKKKIEKKIIFLSVNRDNISDIIGISNLTLSFIKSKKSKLFSSPTKVGESFACGIPVVSSKNIGDLDNDLKNLKSGYILNDKNFLEKNEIAEIFNQKQIDKEGLRKRTSKKYSLNSAIIKYTEVYKKL